MDDQSFRLGDHGRYTAYLEGHRMRYIGFFAMAIAGLNVGLFVGIAINGFSNPVVTLVLGLCGAVLLFLIQIPVHIENQDAIRRYRARRKHVPRVPRIESDGSFSERLERFKENVGTSTQSAETESMMELWIAKECEHYERNPSKRIGIIRRLLMRIQKVLSQK